MNLRRPLIILVYGFVVLVVTFAVLCGATQLTAAVGDRAGAILLGRWTIGSLILLVIDIVLLVGAMGVKTLDDVDHAAAERTSGADLEENPHDDTAADAPRRQT